MGRALRKGEGGSEITHVPLHFTGTATLAAKRTEYPACLGAIAPKLNNQGGFAFMGKDVFIDWQLGTQAAFDRVVPLGAHNGELLCRRPGVAPLAPRSRSVVPHGQRTRVDEGRSASAKFAQMSNTDRLGVALKAAVLEVGPEMGGKLQELISPTNLAIMAGALAIWVGAHATPIGWVVDIGMVGQGVVALGIEAVNVMRELHAFAMGVIRARSEVELVAAGQHLAKAIAIVGVDVVVAVLLKKAIVKVRQPAPQGADAANGPKLFGKYDPRDAVKSLPPEGAAASSTKGAVSATKKVVPSKVGPAVPEFHARNFEGGKYKNRQLSGEEILYK